METPYKVTFDSVVIVKNLSLEDSIQFALNLHRSSNVPHKVQVIHDDIIDLCLLTDIQ